MLSKQLNRYNHSCSIGGYSIATLFPNSRGVDKLSSHSSISKKILLNLTLFEKKKMLFFKEFFLNKNVNISYLHNLKSTNAHNNNILISNTSLYVVNDKNNIDSYKIQLYKMLIRTFLLRICQFVACLRKAKTLLIITHKFLN